MLNNLNVFPISNILYFIYDIYTYLFTINIFNFLNKKEIDDRFIYIEKNTISRDLCNEIICKFEKDERKDEGNTGRGIDKSLKITNDLCITDLPEWNVLDKILCNILFASLHKYLYTTIINDTAQNLIILSQITNKFTPGGLHNITDFGYQVQKYDKNTGFYEWHNDFIVVESRVRYITFIWYLNDVHVGGQTEFLHGKIKPEAGKLLFFPATWTYLHRGTMPISDDKYIVTGWIGYII
jgi:hypothetical protein